jgi:hypothetical protein
MAAALRARGAFLRFLRMYRTLPRTFRTPMTLDRKQLLLTGAVGLILVVVTGVTLVANGGGYALALVGLVTALSWAMSPRALVVDDGELRVERRAWPALRVPLASVVGAAPLDRLGQGALRLFGVGGFFGSYGLFSSRDLGRFRLYATRGGQALIVRRTGDALPLVLTPDDVAGAIDAIDRRPQLTE